MKRNQMERKLSVRRDTIRELARLELKQIAGGESTNVCTAGIIVPPPSMLKC